MLKIENVKIVGWEPAIRGMRNPKNSWALSDSYELKDTENGVMCPIVFSSKDCKFGLCDFYVGPADLKLMMQLRNAGTDHRKFLRYIGVYLDIDAPLYWWKEFETYRTGVYPNPMEIEMNSCSTMHKIHDKEFTLGDFSHEHLIMGWGDPEDNKSFLFTEHDVPLDPVDELSDTIKYYSVDSPLNVLEHTISALNHNRAAYLATNDKRFWWQMIQLLPTSYNQRRTIELNYEVLANIHRSRRHHKLDEWHVICDWIEALPYSQIITGKET